MHMVTNWLTGNLRTTILLFALCSLGGGFMVGEMYRSVMERDFRLLLDGKAQREAIGLELETMRGQAMGVTSLLGLNEPIIKEWVLEKRSANDAEGLGRMKVARQMLDADGVYVMNNEGKIVVHETEHESSVGKNIKFRPYWQQAMAGMENVYAAVGSKTMERGLYVADAIRAGTIHQGPIIGVVVIKMLGDYLDQKLAMSGMKALLLSPQGVVFAATEKEWLFRLNGDPTPQRLEAIAKLNQFGKQYGKGNVPHSLPFDVLHNEVHISQKRHARSISPIHWNDPAGDWSLVLFGDLEGATPIEELVLISLLTGMVIFMLLVSGLRAMRESRARMEAVAKTREAAEKLVIEARIKSRHAEFSTLLQQARDLDTLYRSWFGQLSRTFSLHQATLYVLDGEGDQACLTLMGGFGDEQAPETIPLGMGWLGQCAIDRQPMHYALPGEGFWRIHSGLGSVLPRSLLILPLMRSERLLGVLELASLDATFAEQQHEIEEMSQQLATNLEVLLIARRTENTLEVAHRVEAWLLALIDGLAEVVCVVDAEGRIVMTNRAARATLGIDGSDASLLEVKDLLPAGVPEVGERVQSVRSGFGDPFMAAVNAFPLPDHPQWRGGRCVVIRKIAEESDQ
ncbi:MAG: GAF domain-containing protein [Magnetococcus sp. YQC-9]